MSFFNHLQKVNMTYTRHARHSLKLAGVFARGSVRATQHAIVPSLHERSSQETVQQASKILYPPAPPSNLPYSFHSPFLSPRYRRRTHMKAWSQMD